jgi:hypothetical protein
VSFLAAYAGFFASIELKMSMPLSDRLPDRMVVRIEGKKVLVKQSDVILRLYNNVGGAVCGERFQRFAIDQDVYLALGGEHDCFFSSAPVHSSLVF